MDEPPPPTREEYRSIGNAAMVYCHEKNNEAIQMMVRSRRDHPHIEKFELVGTVTDLIMERLDQHEMALLYVELLYEAARKK